MEEEDKTTKLLNLILKESTQRTKNIERLIEVVQDQWSTIRDLHQNIVGLNQQIASCKKRIKDFEDLINTGETTTIEEDIFPDPDEPNGFDMMPLTGNNEDAFKNKKFKK